MAKNGHMASRSAGADFQDRKTVKIVALDAACRLTGHDALMRRSICARTALTLTIPALMAARWIYCIVPGPTMDRCCAAHLAYESPMPSRLRFAPPSQATLTWISSRRRKLARRVRFPQAKDLMVKLSVCFEILARVAF
jgi:6-phosphogluconolactonase/glucosamine-6-phosphate isomerase/deaminase